MLIIDCILEGGSGFVISDEKFDIYCKLWLKIFVVGWVLMVVIKNLFIINVLIKIGDCLCIEW